ncbi:hypothetical protein PINS_up002828 [Pythium insidiosum]|nr:hypothetical protein PINS_up002828 [Pythium insidiosum]
MQFHGDLDLENGVASRDSDSDGVLAQLVARGQRKQQNDGDLHAEDMSSAFQIPDLVGDDPSTILPNVEATTTIPTSSGSNKNNESNTQSNRLVVSLDLDDFDGDRLLDDQDDNSLSGHTVGPLSVESEDDEDDEERTERDDGAVNDVAHQVKAEARGPPLSLVVALFCDGFVCRHRTRINGWIEGFAQSYDETSSYFIKCLNRGDLPDGLAELAQFDATVRAEIWDFRQSPTALCPLTSADLPASIPGTLCNGVDVVVRCVELQPRDKATVITDLPKVSLHFGDADQFPQLSPSELVTLTDVELSTLTLDPTDPTDLLENEESLEALEAVLKSSCTDGDETPPTDHYDAELDPGCVEEQGMSTQSPQSVRVKSHRAGRGKSSVAIDVCNAEPLAGAFELITPKRTIPPGQEMPPWSHSSSSSSMAFLSPTEPKAIKSGDHWDHDRRVRIVE